MKKDKQCAEYQNKMSDEVGAEEGGLIVLSPGKIRQGVGRRQAVPSAATQGMGCHSLGRARSRPTAASPTSPSRSFSASSTWYSGSPSTESSVWIGGAGPCVPPPLWPEQAFASGPRGELTGYLPPPPRGPCQGHN